MPFVALDSAHYRMANRLAGGQLDRKLAALQSQGLSLEKIASRLYADHLIEASIKTVQKWLQSLPDEEEAAS